MREILNMSGPQKKIPLDTEQDLTPHASVFYGGSSASGPQPSVTTSTDQNTGTSDVTREVRTGPTQDATRASSKDHIGGDGAMEGDSADENSAGHPSRSGSDNRTKREPREVRDEQSSTTEQHVPRRISGKTTPQEHAVAVTTQGALDGYREKTMTIASVENNTLNFVSISSARALDMTHCNFSVRSARDEMRHIIGRSEPDVIIGSDKDQNRECRKKDKDMELLCELYEAQAACGRHFVHELTSEVNSRMQCVAKIMAMPRTRTTVADLRMFGLAACDELRKDQQQLKTGEQKKKAEDAKRILGLFTKMRRTKERVTCKMKWGNPCITMSRTCSACGKDGIEMTRKAGGLIQSCAPRQDGKQWSTFVPT